MIEKYQSILEHFIERWEKKEWFPKLYCNACARDLQRVLKRQGIESEIMFSYQEECDGHSFLITPEWMIIDPTYGQYNECYLKGFIWSEFPDATLQNNIMWWPDFMKLQLKRMQEWKYDFQ